MKRIHKMVGTMAWVTMAGVLGLAAWGQAPAVATGPEVGAKIPAFALTDQTGQRQTFDSLKGPNGMLLAFVRSADWCPFCKTQLVDLNSQRAAYQAQGVNIVSISYDTGEVLAHFTERQKIGFKLLSDPESATIKAFGILNTTVEPDNPVYGIPFPGMYVLDANGVVKAKYFEDNFQERYSAASVLTREFGANGVPVSSVDNKHLKLSSYASDAGFAPGRRITLVLELDMKDKMHVYAPGIEGYIPLNWTMNESSAYQTFDAGYPQSKMLHLPAINETVPVYDGKIRIVRDILVGGGQQIASEVKDGTLTVEGKFRYQACDDRECYLPQDVPLKWTFNIGQMDTQRVPEPIRMR